MKTLTATAIVSAASACLTSLIFVGIVNVATTSDVGASVAPLHTITVQASRMTAEEKLAYDLELAQIQTVVVRSTGMTAKEKIAYDVELANLPVSQVVVIHAKRLSLEQVAAERALELVAPQ